MPPARLAQGLFFCSGSVFWFGFGLVWFWFGLVWFVSGSFRLVRFCLFVCLDWCVLVWIWVGSTRFLFGLFGLHWFVRIGSTRFGSVSLFACSFGLFCLGLPRLSPFVCVVCVCMYTRLTRFACLFVLVILPVCPLGWLADSFVCAYFHVCLFRRS